MARRRDPIEREADRSVDLYEITTWEPRSVVDRISLGLYRVGVATVRAVVIVLALLFLVVQFVLGGLGAITEPLVGALVILSVVPALAIAIYVWYADVTTGEPLDLLVVTFLLGVLFATFAAVVNTLAFPAFERIPALLGMSLFFFLVVGPVEETVKLLAIRLHAYRSARFDAVIDGAVYGAAAGLGFATIENAIFITRGLETGLSVAEAIGAAGGTAVVRALAGPGHVLYSAIAGFYLGLAKFNPENAGPIVVKGLLIAALFHAGYNTLVSVVPAVAVATFDWLTIGLAIFGFIVLYDGVVAYFLYRKIAAYRSAYRDAGVAPDPDLTPELDEFDA